LIILDTNVVSELMRPTPDTAVKSWVRKHRGRQLWTTSISLAEVYYGVERLPAGRRKDQSAAAARDVFGVFADRILAFDAAAAQHFALVVAGRDRAGLPIEAFDGQIAAICAVHDASLATRNVKDFIATGIETIDPWQV
jgi:predicted nucleic acid-binding protein